MYLTDGPYRIWAAIASSSQDVLKSSGVDPKEVKGVGFDA
jgi:ribulose kinase